MKTIFDTVNAAETVFYVNGTYIDYDEIERQTITWQTNVQVYKDDNGDGVWTKVQGSSYGIGDIAYRETALHLRSDINWNMLSESSYKNLTTDAGQPRLGIDDIVALRYNIAAGLSSLEQTIKVLKDYNAVVFVYASDLVLDTAATPTLTSQLASVYTEYGFAKAVDVLLKPLAQYDDTAMMQATARGASMPWYTASDSARVAAAVKAWGAEGIVIYDAYTTGHSGETVNNSVMGAIQTAATITASTQSATTSDDVNLITGTDSNDTLHASARNDLVYGAAGTDTAIFTGGIKTYKLTDKGNGFAVAGKGTDSSTDTLYSIEKLTFSDATVDLTMAGKAATISASTLHTLEELYVGFFNRVPEASGLGYWIDQLASGTSIEAVGNAFYTAGVDFGLYSKTMTVGAFVAEIYKNVLGRSGATAPNNSEIGYWADWLTQHNDSKGAMVLQMLSDSHNFYTNDVNFGWVVKLLNNKAEVADHYAIDLGLSSATPQASINFGMQLAAAITPDSTTAAITLIGVADYAGV